MKNQIFTIFDQKANAYLTPFFLPTIEMAQRTFGDCANDTEHAFGKHPSDYTLMHIGSFEDATANFELNEPYISLGSALEYLALLNNDHKD